MDADGECKPDWDAPVVSPPSRGFARGGSHWTSLGTIVLALGVGLGIGWTVFQGQGLWAALMGLAALVGVARTTTA